MKWMNYHHLYYFWVIAREGGVTKACQKLRLSQPTLSSQLKQFEDFIGKPLFERKSRKLILNDAGKTVFATAEKIFKMGDDLLETIQDDQEESWVDLKVGVQSTLPKKDVYEFLQIPIMKPHVRLQTCLGTFDFLLQQLLQKNIDMILASQKAPAELKDVYNYSLDQSPMVFVAHKDLKNLRRRFPKSLNDKPLFVPSSYPYLESYLEEFFQKHEINPVIKGEIQDSELLRVIVASGEGVVLVERSAVSDLLKSKELVALGGQMEWTQSFFLISSERKYLHPLVKDILKKFK